MPLLQQSRNQSTTDVAGSACNQNPHTTNLAHR
jgi:hypothetical protein